MCSTHPNPENRTGTCFSAAKQAKREHDVSVTQTLPTLFDPFGDYYHPPFGTYIEPHSGSSVLFRSAQRKPDTKREFVLCCTFSTFSRKSYLTCEEKRRAGRQRDTRNPRHDDGRPRTPVAPLAVERDLPTDPYAVVVVEVFGVAWGLPLSAHREQHRSRDISWSGAA